MRFLKAEPMWKTDVKWAIFTPEKNTYIILTSQNFARVPLLGNALKWLNLISRPSYNTPRIIIFWWRAQNSAKRPPTGHSSLHHQHYLHDGPGLHLPLSVRQSAHHLGHQTSGGLAPFQPGLPSYCNADQYRTSGLWGYKHHFKLKHFNVKGVERRKI